MKKIFGFGLLLVIAITMSGCTFPMTSNDQLSEQELEALIDSLVEEQQATIDYTIQGFEDAVTDMIEFSRNGVIGIDVDTAISSGTGSGVIYKKEATDTSGLYKYYLVTNDHVMVHEDDGGTRYQPLNISIVFERNGLLFEVIDENIDFLGSDPVTDLAVLSFVSTQDFSVIPLADSYEVELGQFVFAIGNPLGFDYFGTVTMGVVSGLARYYVNDDFNATLLQHDAAISPGNSGGALLNINGELIGINNMKLVDDYVSNIGFAIPSNTVKRIAADLEPDGIVLRPYLGISTTAQVNLCDADYGVCLLTADGSPSVQFGGAAYNAGLVDGDIIIGYKNQDDTEFMDMPNFNVLKEAILNSQVGEFITLKYIHNGVVLTTDPTELKLHPDDQE